jgi:hypothetical protein
MQSPIQMTALAYQNYGGLWYVNGQDMLVGTEEEARDMEALHLARRRKVVPPAPSDVAPVPQSIETREMVPVKSNKQKEKDPKKRYHHREMRVDES